MSQRNEGTTFTVTLPLKSQSGTNDRGKCRYKVCERPLPGADWQRSASRTGLDRERRGRVVSVADASACLR